MSEHDPKQGTARWLVYCLCAAGLLAVSGYAGLKVAEQRQLARFRQITPSMNTWDIVQLCGKPTRTWGSGILRYEYDIIGGGTVTITYYGMQPGLVVYDGEVLFERILPPPVDPVTISLSSKPMPTSDAWRKTLQTNSPPKRVVPEP